ncbi:hypothetical protein P4S72_22710 [Vibrio sp. PP-XX7]
MLPYSGYQDKTKIEGFAFNLIQGHIQLGWPILKESTLFLFQHEYNLPLIPYTWAAYLATTAEHILPILLLFWDCDTICSARHFCHDDGHRDFVYPEAYATHTTWLTISAFLLLRGAGILSVDHLFSSRRHINHTQ